MQKISSCNKELNDFVVDDSTPDTITEFAYLNVKLSKHSSKILRVHNRWLGASRNGSPGRSSRSQNGIGARGARDLSHKPVTAVLILR